jgi:hypothetical protein
MIYSKAELFARSDRILVVLLTNFITRLNVIHNMYTFYNIVVKNIFFLCKDVRRLLLIIFGS